MAFKTFFCARLKKLKGTVHQIKMFCWHALQEKLLEEQSSVVMANIENFIDMKWREKINC